MALGTAAYVPYAVIAAPARSGRSVLPRILESKKITLSPESAVVTRVARTALWGRNNYVSGHDASVPKPTRGSRYCNSSVPIMIV